MLHGTIFNDNFQRNIVAQKIDTCVTYGVCRQFLTQHLLPQRAAQLWTDLKYLQRYCNKLSCYTYRFFAQKCCVKNRFV